MSLNLFDSRPRQDPRRVEEIKEWATEVFRLPADASVFVTELRCMEPGCPPLETVIAILHESGRPHQHKIHKAIADVTFADVLQLARRIVIDNQDSRNREDPS
jgi:hypothetical protein